MTIAVTGATGPFGRHAVETLLERMPAGDVVAIVRNPEKATDLAGRGVDVRVASYDDRAALDKALVGVDTVLLVSGNEVGKRVQQHSNVIDAAKAAGASRVVYTSAPKATDTDLVLAPEHAATEEHLRSAGIGFTVVRNNWYTENYAARLDEWQGSGEIAAAAGAGRVASATRAELAEGAAIVAATEGHEGQVYEFGGDVAWDFEELAATASAVLGRAVAYRAVEPDALVSELVRSGLDQGTAGFVAALDANIASGALDVVTGDLSRVLGRPTSTLEDALRAARA
ncbi:SDR family oxidoreductase [Desertivibrio insolitus]|uniref:SDR family oxidoreductase n=1 Tax=Herbiconiux sp. SYSU D00978 TaxID=2812562 RepID=UPI001A968E17|nr:SDR family oxidoreductase [Herbiconiux sp. SYSU D00978]